MKKLLICIVIMTSGMCVASCGKKNANSVESADSTVVASNNEEVQVQASNSGANTVENEYVKVTVPEGWECDEAVTTERVLRIKLKPGTDFGEWQLVRIFTNNTADAPNDWQDMAKSCVEGEANRSLGEDVTFGSMTYKQVKFQNSADTHCILFGKMPKGVLEITLTEKLTLDNPSVKAILESISFK